jgi:hypothetical protein
MEQMNRIESKESNESNRINSAIYVGLSKPAKQAFLSCSMTDSTRLDLTRSHEGLDSTRLDSTTIMENRTHSTKRALSIHPDSYEGAPRKKCSAVFRRFDMAFNIELLGMTFNIELLGMIE